MGDFWFKISVVLLLMVSSSSLPDGLPSINSNPSERDIMKDMKLFGGRGGGSSRSGGSFGGSRGGSSGGGSRGSYGGGGAGEGSGSGSVPRSKGGGSGSSVGYGSTIPLYGGIAGGRNSGGEDKRHKHSAACKGFNLSLATTLALVAAALGASAIIF